MPRIMLDTNIISYVLKRPHTPMAERYRKTPAADIVISSIVEHELRYGVARMPKEAHLPLIVEEALRTLAVAAWDSECAKLCATVRASLQSVGVTLSYADAMIAAHAIVLDLTLVTNDRAFEYVPDLRIENWATDPNDPLK